MCHLGIALGLVTGCAECQGKVVVGPCGVGEREVMAPQIDRLSLSALSRPQKGQIPKRLLKVRVDAQILLS